MRVYTPVRYDDKVIISPHSHDAQTPVTSTPVKHTERIPQFPHSEAAQKP